MNPTPAPSSGPHTARPQRHLLLLRGEAPQTAAEARAACAALDAARICWIGEGQPPEGVSPQPAYASAALLGQDFDAVVLDLHTVLDVDQLSQAQGLVRAGGCLVLRLDDAHAPLPPREHELLRLWPDTLKRPPTRRLRARLAQRLFAHAAALAPPLPLRPCPPILQGSAEQAALVERLRARLARSEPTLTVIMADRGRGKSAALGMALAPLDPRTVRVSAQYLPALRSLRHFAGWADRPAEAPPLFAFADLFEQLDGARVIVIDEAAQLPISALLQLVRRCPHAHLVFATTTHGYEGTGRGFELRFVPQLGGDARPLHTERLEEPIRWARGDALEARLYDALLLDASPSPLTEAQRHRPGLRCLRVDRDALAADEPMLRGLFGLLLQAHYRTTPSDLHRLLDAPNLSVWVALGEAEAGREAPVLAGCLLAQEGPLSAEVAQQAARGAVRLRGHALPDNLASHLGQPEAATWPMLRSVRLASHPGWRRRGAASALTEAIHTAMAGQNYAAIGTLFAATPGVIRFRQRLGYEVIRLSAARSQRAGEPSVVMWRPLWPEARTLHEALRQRLAFELPMQLRLLQAAPALPLGDELCAALTADLPAAQPLSAAAHDRIIRSYLFGPATFEGAAQAVFDWLSARPEVLHTQPAAIRALIEVRVLAQGSWVHAAQRAQMSVPAAMRALRRALRPLYEVHGGSTGGSPQD